MTRSFVQLGQSAWWLIVILLISVGLSYFLYTKKNVPWSQTKNWILFGIRSLAVFLLLLLLLEPSIKKVVNTIQRPIVNLAIDNSQSILARGADSTQLKNSIDFIREELEDQGIEVEIYTLSDNPEVQFDQQTSRLSGLFSSIDDSYGENQVATVLLTDGIFNRGSSPLYRNYLQPVYTVGLGDTIPLKDISISRTRYNKITFKGNQTPIRLEVSQQGYTGLNSSIQLTEKGKVLMTKNVTLSADVQEIEFIVSSEKEGLRHLVASIPTQTTESTAENNRTDIFLEVIDGRQKILIVAGSPHPDIKAIRRSLDETDSYLTELYIPSIQGSPPNEIYDVIIYHGAFNTNAQYVPKEPAGLWYILSSESLISAMNKNLPFLNIERIGGQPDKVTGSFNQNFSKFKVDDMEIFENYPPIDVPFAEYSVGGASEVLMYQKLGSVVTKKPLMVINDDGIQKSAVLMGQDIWKWKFQEAAINDNSSQFDNFVTKTVQFLSVKNDKKQFRFESRSATFNKSEPLLFDGEVYNDIYERIYGNLIEIRITDEANKTESYEFVDSELINTFRAPGLTPGIYRFQASVQVGQNTFTENGEFLVEDVNQEFLNLTADHRLLKNLSRKTDGEFIPLTEVETLPEIIKEQNFKPILTSEEDFQELRRAWWYYLLIFVAFSTEWFLRRYWGGY